MFAVQDIALYASNGCYYSVCPIHVSICIRHIRVLPLSLSVAHTAPCYPKKTHEKENSTFYSSSFSVINYMGYGVTYNVNWCYFPFNFWSKNVSISFARRTDVMPAVPLETKYHPSAVDLLLIKRLIAETSKQNLLQFLQHEFVNIGKSHAERLIGIKIFTTHFYYDYAVRQPRSCDTSYAYINACTLQLWYLMFIKEKYCLI